MGVRSSGRTTTTTPAWTSSASVVLAVSTPAPSTSGGVIRDGSVGVELGVLGQIEVDEQQLGDARFLGLDQTDEGGDVVGVHGVVPGELGQLRRALLAQDVEPVGEAVDHQALEGGLLLVGVGLSGRPRSLDDGRH